MRIIVGADHRGYLMKDALADAIRAAGHDVVDIGTNGPESVDYPDIARAVGEVLLVERDRLLAAAAELAQRLGPGEEDPGAVGELAGACEEGVTKSFSTDFWYLGAFRAV